MKRKTQERKIIPVVVHIIHDFGNENVTDAKDVHYVIEQLNKNINRQARQHVIYTSSVRYLWLVVLTWSSD